MGMECQTGGGGLPQAGAEEWRPASGWPTQRAFGLSLNVDFDNQPFVTRGTPLMARQTSSILRCQVIGRFVWHASCRVLLPSDAAVAGHFRFNIQFGVQGSGDAVVFGGRPVYSFHAIDADGSSTTWYRAITIHQSGWLWNPAIANPNGITLNTQHNGQSGDPAVEFDSVGFGVSWVQTQVV